MNLNTFFHAGPGEPTTISEISRIHREIETQEFMGLYAYATQSGAALFDLQLNRDFWEKTPSRWLFGIDYGRTQPQALRLILSKTNADIRIYDGEWVANQSGFIPRRDFHVKMAILTNAATNMSGMVVGSGNFSSNGLRKSVEAGASVLSRDAEDFNVAVEPILTRANRLWDQATPISDILAVYEKRWNASFYERVEAGRLNAEANHIDNNIFWIEAGYVTKNRGEDRPGNQIDFPRGMSRYFGFNVPEDQPANTLIGRVTFETPAGERVSNNLRLGNNMMEKISLPIPESHGFDIYDGKIIVFERVNDCFLMRALEADDFETAFGKRLAETRIMASGRRYGHIF